jgi:hypothetical protein
MVTDLKKGLMNLTLQKRQGSVFVIFITLLLTLSGCAINPALPTESERINLKKTAVVPDQFLPEAKFNTFAKGRIVGAGKGLLLGFGVLLGAPLLGAGIGTTAGPGGSLVGAFLGAVVGAAYLPASPIVGAIRAVPGKEAAQINQAVQDTLIKLKVQERFAEHVVKAGEQLSGYRFERMKASGSKSRDEKPSYEGLKIAGFDSVLHIAMDELGFEGGKGSNPSIAFFMKGHSRLVRIADDSELYTTTFEYKSAERTMSTWLANDSKALQEEFDHGYHKLAAETLEKPFLLVNFPESKWWPSHDQCMLLPLYPEFKSGFFEIGPKLIEVDSLQPTLQWESFPRETDTQNFTNQVSNVTYDLKIWSAMDESPDVLIYEKTKLPAPYHKLQQPLNSSTHYFWTVRAQFNENGQQRVTNWSYSRSPGALTCTETSIPNDNYYRFVTP